MVFESHKKKGITSTCALENPYVEILVLRSFEHNVQHKKKNNVTHSLIITSRGIQCYTSGNEDWKLIVLWNKRCCNISEFCCTFLNLRVWLREVGWEESTDGLRISQSGKWEDKGRVEMRYSLSAWGHLRQCLPVSRTHNFLSCFVRLEREITTGNLISQQQCDRGKNRWGSKS